MMSTIEMNGVSDTEGDKDEDVKEPLRASPVATPVFARKVSAPILKKVLKVIKFVYCVTQKKV